MRRESSEKRSHVQLWAGAECTVNRVEDAFLDQLEYGINPHLADHLHLLSELGVSTVRFPVLWERVAPAGLNRARWEWSDRGLERLRELHLRPVVGLVHHGSGPAHTSLLDPGFAEGLAEFAREVAERYPWVDGYTPVNEPLTTARFSGLYGVWYPHRRSMRDCVRMVLNECRAVILSMRAIRSVNPAAYLVQTEDLGKTHSTPALAYQAEFNNDFRWLSFDLLCGMIDAEHPLWNFLLSSGVTEAELAWFEENPCPPDIFGLDHYLSGERFLDEHVERYPDEPAGGNGRQQYVDVLAARVLAEGTEGPKALLREVWDRYRRPLAVTEVHNGCTREEQMRWFLEVWDAANELRSEGVDIRGVSAWAFFGMYGWDQLCIAAGGNYEAGVYDARTSPPRPTAMVPMLRSLVAGHRAEHPLLAVPGWWKRDVRLEYGHALRRDGSLVPPARPGDITRERVYRAPPLLIVVAGRTGRELASLCRLRGIPYRTVSAARVGEWAAVLRHASPWAVVVDDAPEAEPLRHACEADGVPVVEIPTGILPSEMDDALNDMLDRLIDGKPEGSGGPTESTARKASRVLAGHQRRSA